MKTSRSWSEVLPRAERMLELLRPGCDRIELAGSVRRREAIVGDVEMVAIPTRTCDLLGEPNGESLLDPILDGLVERGALIRIKGGEKFKQFTSSHDGLQLDLWLVRPETWGVQTAIRTGPADFSKAFVTRECYGGLLRDDLTVSEGRVWRGRISDEEGVVRIEGTPLETPEEADFFKWTRCGYREPWERSRICELMLAGKR